MKKTNTILVYLLSLIFLCSCNLPNNESKKKNLATETPVIIDVNTLEPSIEPSAYDSLSTSEKLFFDLFMKHIYDFKDPVSVRIVGFDYCPKEGSTDALFTVSANNGFGGTVQNHFDLVLKDHTVDNITFRKGRLSEASQIFQLSSCGESVKKINLAIKEYFEDRGY